MVAKVLCLFALVAAASAVAVPGIPLAKVAYAEPEAPAAYQYTYSVQDTHTGDVKQQQEARNGDAVQGSYSLVQPDGVQRIVEYTSDAVHGFNAIVRYEGTPVHAAPAKIAVAAAPIAKVAYAPAPVAKIAYAPAPVSYAPAPVSYAPAPVAYAQAPVAKVAYAAPVAKLAYPAQAAYAPAPISYAAGPAAYAPAAYAPAPVAYASAPAYAPAPVAKLAYAAAPVAKYAYTENLGHVSFASPAVSYHH